MANTVSNLLNGNDQCYSLSEEDLAELLSQGSVELAVEGCAALVNRVTLQDQTFILIDTGENRLAIRMM